MQCVSARASIEEAATLCSLLVDVLLHSNVTRDRVVIAATKLANVVPSIARQVVKKI